MPNTTMPTPGITTAATTNTTRSKRRRRTALPARPRVGAVGRVAAGVLSLLLVIQAAPRLVAGILIAPHEPTVRLIARHNLPSRQNLLAARRAYEGALAWHDGAGEWTPLAHLRRETALDLGGLDTAEGQVLLDSARETLRIALAHAPTDPYLWAELAEADRLSHSFKPDFAAALRRSVVMGPFEPTLAAFR